ncbi:MAG: hypothetical protein V2A76_11030 [Planctomycetota bacterium]
MRLYFTTVIRSAPPLRGGELVCLDWSRKEILGRTPLAATNPTLEDPNRRGNTRGGRGISLVGKEVVVCSYHTLRFFDRDLNPIRDLTHPLMVSLHETCAGGSGEGDSIWTASTAVDAALEFDLATGSLLRQFWPREMPGLQQRLGLTPLALDKRADNRGLFLGGEHTQDDHHLHLNAVALFDGEVHALLSRFGTIVNLDRDLVVVEDRMLKGGHNLLIDPEGHALVSHTLGRGVLQYDLRTGKQERRFAFGAAPAVRSLVRTHDLVYAAKRFLAKRRLLPHTPPRPVFVRGLARHGGFLFVGISPATILQIEEKSGELVDLFTYDRRVAACVHGLEVAPDC